MPKARSDAKHRKGGHDVPESKIISRYRRTHTYLPIAISLAHRTYIFDNTVTPQLGAVLRDEEIVEHDRDSPQWIVDALDNYKASKDEKNLLIQRASESEKACSVSLISESEYMGKIEFIGEHYSVQDISKTEVILHHFSLIDSDIPASQNVTIKYRNGVSSTAIT